MLPLSIDESIRFNVAYMITLMIYRFNLLDPHLKLNNDLILSIGVVSIIFVYCTSRSLAQPFFDFSPMKVGRSLPHIFKEHFNPPQQPYILAFMNPDCEDCVKWLKPLKDFHQEGVEVVVIVSKDHNKNRLFYKYKLHVIKPLHYFWLVFESPSIYYIKSSLISQKLKLDDSIHTLER
ncbi:MAG: hypothetical protein KC646_01185 [Candidatus Cloacimonetes bacterium]|nr:hypothetical protein [Candidatus Cloacimonadota bacterium]